MKRGAFVDDEPSVLSAFSGMLRLMSHQWEMEFLSNGSDALAAFERNAFDVIVTDISIPIMHGAELLRQVKSRFPDAVRSALQHQQAFCATGCCVDPVIVTQQTLQSA